MELANSPSGMTTFRSRGWVKLRIYLFYLLLNAFVFHCIIFRAMDKQQMSYIEALAVSSFMFIVVILIFAITPVFWLLKKKFTKEFTVDAIGKTITIGYGPGKSLRYEAHEFAFHYQSNTLCDVVVIYEKIVSTRGHIIYVENAELIGFPLPCAWRMNDLKDIYQTLTNLGFEQHTGRDKNFLDRLFF